MDHITIEFHYGPNNFIKASTRNKCAYNSVEVFECIAKIFGVQDEFDIVFIPAQPGSYKDVLRIVKKAKITANKITAGTSLGILGLTFLGYHDTHGQSLHQQKLWVVEDTQKCLDLQEKILRIGGEYEIENIPEDKIKEICSNITIQKRKNDFYQALSQDKDIEDLETLILNQDGLRIDSSQVKAKDFQKFIELVLDQDFEFDNLSAFFEIVSPVLQQKKEGRGIPWTATYYGDDVIQNEINVLQNGDTIDFYMQDPEFKGQILNEERVFKHGDNMKAIFKIKFQIRGKEVLSRGIYIERVMEYNTEEIPHKEKLIRQKNKIENNQRNSLFDGLE